MTSDDIIEVALPSDQGYFPGLLVAVYTLAKYASKGKVLSFHILDGGIEDASYALLINATERVHPNCVFRRHKVEEKDFSYFPAWKGNKMTYVRFLLPSLLPDKDYVIYADSDCLWHADIADLWSQRVSDVSIQGVFDEYGEQTELPWFAKHNIVFPRGKYFCNGLLLMNLRLFRKNAIIEKAAIFIKEHQDIQYADQTAFNYLLSGNSKLLPPCWNLFTRDISNKSILCPVVLHYANDIPWKKFLNERFVPPYMMLWYCSYAEAKEITLKEVLRAYKVNNIKYYRLYSIVMGNRLFRGLLKIYMRFLGQNYLWKSLYENVNRQGKLIEIRGQEALKQ